MRSSYKKEMKSLLAGARKQGWRVESRRGHWAVWSPVTGHKYTLPGTPSNEGAVWMSKKKLQHGGLVLNTHKGKRAREEARQALVRSIT